MGLFQIPGMHWNRKNPFRWQPRFSRRRPVVETPCSPSLIPMTWKYLRRYLEENRISYQEYLASDHWMDIRSRFWKSKLHKGACDVCGSRSNLQIHHKTYTRIGHERLGDLCLLCGNCHTGTHKLAYQNKKSKSLWRSVIKYKKHRKNCSVQKNKI